MGARFEDSLSSTVWSSPAVVCECPQHSRAGACPCSARCGRPAASPFPNPLRLGRAGSACGRSNSAVLHGLHPTRSAAASPGLLRPTLLRDTSVLWHWLLRAWRPFVGLRPVTRHRPRWPSSARLSVETPYLFDYRSRASVSGHSPWAAPGWGSLPSRWRGSVLRGPGTDEAVSHRTVNLSGCPNRNPIYNA